MSVLKIDKFKTNLNENQEDLSLKIIEGKAQNTEIKSTQLKEFFDNIIFVTNLVDELILKIDSKNFEILIEDNISQSTTTVSYTHLTLPTTPYV